MIARGRSQRLALLTCGSLSLGLAVIFVPRSVVAQDTSAPSTAGCLACHVGIEEMHPAVQLSCVDCHGGNDQAKRKSEAHVASLHTGPEDERVAPIDEDLAWRRFKNPMDLRVVSTTCGTCHEKACEHLKLSLHGTTAGHLSDGWYEMGLLPRRGAAFSVFPVHAGKLGGEVEDLRQVPPFRGRETSDALDVHFTDLTRKECLQCHLWSQGRAVRGRVGFDGDYRGEGCAACHVQYGLDGLSRSGDRSAVRTEPGHPLHHAMTRAPPTQTCTSCHYGDAAIGLNFRGLSQLPPGAPGGPEIQGTTKELLNRQYYLSDPSIDPPDVHHERGMHCIDCHTLHDVMGDGKLHGSMERAVEIACSDCHGTFTGPSTLTTSRGTKIENLRRDGDRVILRSKVTGEDHPVVQLVHVLDKARPEFNPRAAKAMTGTHAKVACTTCHAGWNPNFLGFHFDRNESLTQLDLLTGKRTEGRVTTQEKVFATWKSFYAGLDGEGRIEPYLTGFSTMGSVTDVKGVRILDQTMPTTSAGLSGVTMIHHQMHTTRRSARSCVECHRTSTTWGLGSLNFRLARQLAFVADRRGIEVVALDRARLAASAPLAKLVLPDVTCLEIRGDRLQGFAEYVFAGEGARGVHVIDVRDPTVPRRVAFMSSVEPHGMQLRGDILYVADGPGGLALYDVKRPEQIHLVGRAPMVDARAVFVQWPWAYVADGEAGLTIVDVRAPNAPRAVGDMLIVADDDSKPNAIDVQSLFQYSRPRAKKAPDGTEIASDERTPARNVCALLDETHGLILVDTTEPTRPRQIYPDPKARKRTRPVGAGAFRGLVVQSHVDLAQPQGGTRTTERDYAYLLSERQNGNNRASTLSIYDVTDPTRPKRVGASPAGQATESLTIASFYNAPFLQTVLFAPGEDGVFAIDATVSSQPNQLGALAYQHEAYTVAVESFPFDRMLDESGELLKDVSHEGSRWLLLSEIEKVLSVSAAKLGLLEGLPAAAESLLLVARLEFARRDVDLSGFLDEAELGSTFASFDLDGDGRVSLAEFARSMRALATTPGATGVADVAGDPRYRATRVDPDGDLARLFDGVDPFRFDKDGDGKLDKNETSAALFAALDVDGDGRLTPDELSRCPGETRKIRFGGARAKRIFEALDANHDGAVGPRELKLGDDEWRALDANRDGFVQLPVARGSRIAKAGVIVGAVEWPTRQPLKTLFPLGATQERMLAAYDKDGDGILSRHELEKRPELLNDLDDNGDSQIEPGEIKLRQDLQAALGVEIEPDDFVGRWDFNGDGKVDASEIPLPPWIRKRLGLR